jgi:AraC-like DNA-binding protein
LSSASQPDWIKQRDARQHKNAFVAHIAADAASNRRDTASRQVRSAVTGRLAPFVSAIMYAECPDAHGFDRCLGTGEISLEINLGGDEYSIYDERSDALQRRSATLLVGPALGSTIIDRSGTRQAMCVGFTFGGASAFLRGTPAEALSNELVDLEALWGRQGATLRERLLEQPTPHGKLAVLAHAVATNIDDAQQPDQAVARAARCLERGDTVSETADTIGLTQRSLSRRFRAAIGLSPKQYARAARLRRLINYINVTDEVDWAEAAVATGFYDQSHLIHEFRDLTGILPTAYTPRAADALLHIPASVPSLASHPPRDSATGELVLEPR